MAQAQALLPAYVHFGFGAGAGEGDAVLDNAGAPADWRQVEDLLLQTGTPYVSLHLTAPAAWFAGVPRESREAHHAARVAEAFARSVAVVVRRFGPEHVATENCPGLVGTHLLASALPGVIHQVVEELGCGFILDLSHVRLAAEQLGMDPREYTASLPLAHLRELHVSGVGLPPAVMVARMRAMGGARGEVGARAWTSHRPSASDRRGLGLPCLGR